MKIVADDKKYFLIILLIAKRECREFSKVRIPSKTNGRCGILEGDSPGRSIRIVDLIDVAPNTVGTLLPERHLAISRGDGKNVPEKEREDKQRARRAAAKRRTR